MNKFLITLSLFSLSALLCQAQEVVVRVEFKPAGYFNAKSEEISGRIIFKNNTIKAKKVKVRTDSFKTGIDLRDEHFKQYLKYKKFPQVSASNIEGTDGKGSALFSINGVEKSKNFTYKIKDQIVEVALVIDTSEFQLEKKEYLNLGVSQIVNITILAPLDKR